MVVHASRMKHIHPQQAVLMVPKFPCDVLINMSHLMEDRFDQPIKIESLCEIDEVNLRVVCRRSGRNRVGLLVEIDADLFLHCEHDSNVVRHIKVLSCELNRPFQNSNLSLGQLLVNQALIIVYDINQLTLLQSKRR